MSLSNFAKICKHSDLTTRIPCKAVISDFHCFYLAVSYPFLICYLPSWMSWTGLGQVANFCQLSPNSTGLLKIMEVPGAEKVEIRLFIIVTFRFPLTRGCMYDELILSFSRVLRNSLCQSVGHTLLFFMRFLFFDQTAPAPMLWWAQIWPLPTRARMG